MTKDEEMWPSKETIQQCYSEALADTLRDTGIEPQVLRCHDVDGYYLLMQTENHYAKVLLGCGPMTPLSEDKVAEVKSAAKWLVETTSYYAANHFCECSELSNGFRVGNHCRRPR